MSTSVLPTPPDSAQSWVKFTSAKTSQAFLQGWLDVACTQFPQISAAALLIKDHFGTSLVPAAVWPNEKQDLGHLNAIIDRCLKENRGLVEPATGVAPSKCQLAYPIVVGSSVVGAIVAEVQAGPADTTSLLKHIHWGLGWLIESFQRGTTDQAQIQAQRLIDVTEALAVALQPRKLRETLFDIANDTCRRLGCARVGIGLVDHETVELFALSDVAWIEKSSAITQQYVAAMEEAFDARHILVVPSTTDDGTPTSQMLSGPASYLSSVVPSHTKLLTAQQAGQVLTIPFMSGTACIALMTLQWREASECTSEKITWLEAYAALIPAVIHDKKIAERSLIAQVVHEIKGVANKLFGPKHLLWKAISATSILAIAVLVLAHINYRVTAKTVLEGQTQRVAAAPFEGFIVAAPVRAGDIVQAGQLLAQLDDRDLKVELAKSAGEREQYERKLREAMAAHEMSSVQIYDAQLKQAEAQVRLVTEKIARAKILAPYAGVVVSGDLSQTIGSPVEVGKKLFEIAPLEQYRVILQVDEREIRHIEIGQPGQVVISGVNDELIDFTVTKVTPIASAHDGKNSFRVEAQLSAAADPRLRPGMEGVGKVSVGSRRLWWIITHSFTDWLRLSLWNWLP